tara:strand:+ start:1426 stop:1626 length:201 start_codon:yes stop_codon:yes gene_type:complete
MAQISLSLLEKEFINWNNESNNNLVDVPFGKYMNQKYNFEDDNLLTSSYHETVISFNIIKELYVKK